MGNAINGSLRPSIPVRADLDKVFGEPSASGIAPNRMAPFLRPTSAPKTCESTSRSDSVCLHLFAPFAASLSGLSRSNSRAAHTGSFSRARRRRAAGPSFHSARGQSYRTNAQCGRTWRQNCHRTECATGFRPLSVHDALCANLRTMRVPVGRIIASVTIENVGQPVKNLRCDALVDTGASHLVLPKAWMDRLGLNRMQELDVETATQDVMTGDLCGPAKIQIEGFRAIYNEVLFVDMHPADGFYEPLLGYLVLEQSGAAVDILGHRLVHVKRMDLKKSHLFIPALKTI